MAKFGFAVTETCKSHYTVIAESQEEAQKIFYDYYNEHLEAIGDDLTASENIEWVYESDDVWDDAVAIN